MEGEPSIKCELEDFPEIDLNVQPPSDWPVGMKIEVPDDAFEDGRFITQSAFVKEELDFQGAHIMEVTADYKEVTIHEKVIAEIVSLVKKETPTSSRGGDARVDMKEGIQDGESAASGNHPNEFLNITEGQPSIKYEPEEFPEIDLNVQPPSDRPVGMKIEEPDDAFEDGRFITQSAFVKEELDFQGAHIMKVTIHEKVTAEIVPLVKKETPSSSRVDMKEETQDGESAASGNHSNELGCPDTSDSAVRKIYALCNTRGQNTSTVSERNITNQQNLTTKLTTYTGEKRYSCITCDAKFALSAHLKTHMLTHTGEKPFSCSTCEAKFSHEVYLKRHMLTHTGEKPYSCSTCEAKFSQWGSLKTHILTHSGEKPYSCSTCEAKFRHYCSLKRHVITHTGEKPYSCSTCEAKFSQSGGLKTHMLTHSGEKPFSCSTCQVKFSLRGNLKTHLSTHTGVKPFSCSPCGAKFSSKSGLKRHMLTHTGEKPFSCSACGDKFSSKSGLKSHMFTLTGEKEALLLLQYYSTCEAKFSQGGSLNTRMLTHTGEK